MYELNHEDDIAEFEEHLSLSTGMIVKHKCGHVKTYVVIESEKEEEFDRLSRCFCLDCERIAMTTTTIHHICGHTETYELINVEPVDVAELELQPCTKCENELEIEKTEYELNHEEDIAWLGQLTDDATWLKLTTCAGCGDPINMGRFCLDCERKAERAAGC
jgi:ribosomal protein L32